MIGMVLAVVLSAQPNIFEPSEMSSEVIAVTVDACIGGILKEDKDANKVAAVIFCACSVDAIRLNTKQGKRPPDNAATKEQLQRCHVMLGERMKVPKGKSGT